ncbi:hypothetical protein VCRA2123O286_540004 [Vibrio crassostreae]|uniref:hypothetical protein n=1 Tax=Vibrio TaxID=662 RepID=UPI00246990AA
MTQENKALTQAIMNSLVENGEAAKPESVSDFFSLLNAIEEGIKKNEELYGSEEDVRLLPLRSA